MTIRVYRSSSLANRRKQAALRTHSMLLELRRASQAGAIRQARSLQNQLFGSVDARLDACCRALRRHSRKEELTTALRMAFELNCYCPSREPAEYWSQVKKSGGRRFVFRFGIEQTARQILTEQVLRASFNAPHWQYEHRGRGKDKAVRKALSLAERGEHRNVALLDISNCFTSFDGEALLRHIPLPKRVISHVILAHHPVADGHHKSTVSTPSLQPEPLAGLPQGSVVSNLVASTMLADLDRVLVPGCELIGFRDDLLVLSTTATGAYESARAIRQLLSEHRSGRFGLSRLEITDFSSEFDFLGYELCLIDGMVGYAQPSLRNRCKLLASFEVGLGEDIEAGRLEPVQTERKLSPRIASFREWPIWSVERERALTLASRVLAKAAEKRELDQLGAA